jgi:Kef-type K+ transport system membrane component KefB
MSILALAESMAHNLVPIQMATLGLLILAAHLGGKLFDRLGFSVVTGQLLGGVLVGPWALQSMGFMPAGAAYEQAVESFSFFTFIFVSLVAFSIGEELHLDRLRHVGRSTLVICVIQTTLTFGLVSSGLYFLGRLPFIDALIMGAIGVTTAPAMTFVILNRLRIEGRLRNILGSVEVLSDVTGVILFSVLVQWAEG